MSSPKSNRRSEPFSEYVRKHGQPTVLYFQPRRVYYAETPSEITEWQKNLAERVGLNYPADFGNNAKPAILHTSCGLLDEEELDDCATDYGE